MPGDSLEAQLTDDEQSGRPSSIENFNVKELITELDNVLNSSTFYAKSNITNRNLRGILKGNAFQSYLFTRYGFRLITLDVLIEEKIKNVLSVDGIGRRQIIEMIQKGTVKVEAKSGMDFVDRLLGGGSPR